MESKDFLTVADVSRELHISPRTVRKLFHEGTLPGKFIAGKYIITREALKQYMNIG